MTNFNTPAFSLHSRLEEFNQFQHFCLDYQHGIRSLSGNEHQDFEPRFATTFIYAFFVFNDVYKIDWEISLKKPDDEPTEWRNLSQQEMFWNLAHFRFQNQPTSIHSYTSRLVKYCNGLGVSNPLTELKKIESSRNEYLTDKIANQYKDRQGKGNEISMQSISDFQDSFDLLYKNGNQGAAREVSDGLTHINNVLYFVYLVRCSVFHGRKQLTVATLAPEQDIRLAIYAATIMAMNQVVIDHVNGRIP